MKCSYSAITPISIELLFLWNFWNLFFIFGLDPITPVNNLAVRPASLTHKNRRGRTKSVNVHPSGCTSCKIYMLDTNS